LSRLVLVGGVVVGLGTTDVVAMAIAAVTVITATIAVLKALKALKALKFPNLKAPLKVNLNVLKVLVLKTALKTALKTPTAVATVIMVMDTVIMVIMVTGLAVVTGLADEEVGEVGEVDGIHLRQCLEVDLNVTIGVASTDLGSSRRDLWKM